MGFLVDWLSGAPQSASNVAGNVGNYYNTAGNSINNEYQTLAPQIGQFYQNAENQLVNSTGSPVAQQFGALTQAGLQPGFQSQDRALTAALAANGLTGSGAAANQLTQLSADQSGTLAGAIAPFYASAQNAYQGLLGAGAGAQSAFTGAQAGAFGNNATQGAGAQGSAYTNTYNQSLTDFYNALSAAATGGAGAANPYTPTQTPQTNQYQFPTYSTGVDTSGLQNPFLPSGGAPGGYVATAAQAPNWNPYEAAAPQPALPAFP